MPLENKYSNAVEDRLRITATIFAIAVVLKTLNIRSNHTMGFSIGELVKAYFEDYLTLEEAVLFAHAYITLFPSNEILETNGKVGTLLFFNSIDYAYCLL